MTASSRGPIKRVPEEGLLAVLLLDSDRPDHAASVAKSALAGADTGGCNFLIAAADSAFIVQAPGPSRVAVSALEPGIHVMTNLDLDDDDDPANPTGPHDTGARRLPGLGRPALSGRPDRRRRRRSRDGTRRA